MVVEQTRAEMTMTVSAHSGTGKILAAYLRVRRGKSAEVREYAEGAAFADYDSKGRLLGIEFLAPCQIQVLRRIVRNEPAPIKAFLNRSIPAEFIRKAS
jgi:uncharacterized protein YuzE